jgi:hypothetical protein
VPVQRKKNPKLLARLRHAGDWRRAVGAGPSGEDSCSSLDSIPFCSDDVSRMLTERSLMAKPPKRTFRAGGFCAPSPGLMTPFTSGGHQVEPWVRKGPRNR